MTIVREDKQDPATTLSATLSAGIEQETVRVATDVLAPRGLERRRVMIVGGAGYVGTVLAAHLLRQGFDVVVYDNLTYNHGLLLTQYLANPGFEFKNCDINDAAGLDEALAGVTDVVLLAGLVGDPITKKYPEQAKQVNDLGYDVVFDALNGKALNRVVFVSTCSNYGLMPEGVLANEESELKPLSLYAKSKVAIEKKIISSAGDVDYVPTILRFATAFGLSPRMRFDLTVSEFTRILAMGEELLVYDADTWRPYCHVQDFARLIERVISVPKELVMAEVFNAGGDANNYTKAMIVDEILKRVPDGKVEYGTAGSDPRNYRVDFSKVMRVLEFTPAVTVPDGIDELLAAMGQGLFRDIEHAKSIYGNWDL